MPSMKLSIFCASDHAAFERPQNPFGPWMERPQGATPISRCPARELYCGQTLSIRERSRYSQPEWRHPTLSVAVTFADNAIDGVNEDVELFISEGLGGTQFLDLRSHFSL
jgi:hypothetical protein